MKYVSSFIMKFIITFGILYLILGLFYGVSLYKVFLTSFVVSLTAYVLDILLVPSVGNVMGVISDLLLSFTVIWLIGTYLFDYDIGSMNFKKNEFPLLQVSTVSAIALSVGEWFFHKYMARIIDQPRERV